LSFPDGLSSVGGIQFATKRWLSLLSNSFLTLSLELND
jgi:hypothetical protein